jgi:signal transduction histidine kinase
MAKALSREPRLLLLDEPTAALGLAETEQVEELLARLRARGTAVLLTGREVKQMFRLADRIVVLRGGGVVADLDPRDTHPDDVAALLSGQPVDTSARRQLTRLHGLADSLLSADPSSSLSLILSALRAALGAEQACIHVASGDTLTCADSLGFSPEESAAWSSLALGEAGGPVGRAAASGERIVEALPGARTAWSMPVAGQSGVSAVITLLGGVGGEPERDELDLLTLYAGYTASAVERDRLLEQVTSRNRVLETIREMLQTLAGPVTVADGLALALASLRRGLRADEVALVTLPPGGAASWRAYACADPTGDPAASPALTAAADRALSEPARDGRARELTGDEFMRVLAVPFGAPAGPTALVAGWRERLTGEEERALIEDAAHSLNLALEREEAGLAHQEAAALRRSRQLQRGFLSMLSHELRTPLTAIRGYASSLMAPDVTWDGASQQRFLERIAVESARLGRLVDDLLDFSAIESGLLRLQRDWCDIPLVIEAAVSCLPHDAAAAVSVSCEPGLPPVWADHDRLEQVLLNLLANAVRHNPPGTPVRVSALHLPGDGAGMAQIIVADEGAGFPADRAANPFEPSRGRRTRSAGAGIGLSIARGIVDAHGGRIELTRAAPGATFRIRLPVELDSPRSGEGDERPEPVPALAAEEGSARA